MASTDVADVTAPAPARRMSSDERREQIVLAAVAVFGARGYVGTRTDDIAKAAGISQPYVVRLFGSKEALFLAAMEQCRTELIDTLRGALTEAGDDIGARKARMGDAYVELLHVRGLHAFLSQSFLLGGHPAIGPAARDCFADIWRLVHDEAGMTDEQGTSFLAMGMLINTLLGLRVTSAYGRDARMTELLDKCFPTTVESVLDAAPRVDEAW